MPSRCLAGSDPTTPAASALPVPVVRTIVALCLSTVLVTGCGGARGGVPGPDDSGPSEELVVAAASSLSDVFGTLADEFERTHRGVEVDLVVAGSSRLVAQIDQGAPIDVVALADEATIGRLADGGNLADGTGGGATVFATNRIVLVVEAGNPLGIESLDDLARRGRSVSVVLCAPEVPCGDYTRRVLDSGEVDVEPVSLESSVRSVLTKVALGEADAGFVYATDAAAVADAVTVIELPEAGQVIARSLIAVTAHGQDSASAKAFVDLVLTTDGQEALSAAGFGAP